MPTSKPLPIISASPLDTLLIILCSPTTLNLFRVLETILLTLIPLFWYMVGLIVKKKSFRPRFKFVCTISLCLYWYISNGDEEGLTLKVIMSKKEDNFLNKQNILLLKAIAFHLHLPKKRLLPCCSECV